jgi:hypothetical protein
MDEDAIISIVVTCVVGKRVEIRIIEFDACVGVVVADVVCHGIVS